MRIRSVLGALCAVGLALNAFAAEKLYTLTIKGGTVWSEKDNASISSLSVPAGTELEVDSGMNFFKRWAVSPTLTNLGPEFDASNSYTYIRMPTMNVTLTANGMVRARATGPGTVSSPTNGQLLPGKSVTLIAKPDKDAVFVGWIYGYYYDNYDSWMPESSWEFLSLKSSIIITEKDEFDCDDYVAVFRLKSECEAPVFSWEGEFESDTAIVGVSYQCSFQVNPSALPVKFTAKGLPAGLSIDSVTGVISGVPKKIQETPADVVVTATSVVNPKLSATTTLPLIVAPLPAVATGAFNGYFYRDEERWENGRWVRSRILGGFFSLTASATGKITAKTVLENETISYTTASWSGYSKWDDVFDIELQLSSSKSDRVVRLTLNVYTGEINGLSWSNLGESYSVLARRSPLSITKTDSGYAEVMEVLNSYADYYTFGVGVNKTLDQGGAENIPQGYGYFTATVSNKANTKLAGKLADGTSFSASVEPFLDEEGEIHLYPFALLYGSKKGSFGGEINLANTTGSATWKYPGTTPTGKNIATEDRFKVTTEIIGGRYSKTTDLRDYAGLFFSVGSPNSLTGFYYDYLYPDGGVELISDAKGGALKPLYAGKAPVQKKEVGYSYYEYNDWNPCVVTLSATKGTGLFKGKFNLYNEYYDNRDALKLKTTSVSHEGILLPGRGGLGYYLVPDTWVDEDTGKKYSIKRSFPVMIGMD